MNIYRNWEYNRKLNSKGVVRKLSIIIASLIVTILLLLNIFDADKKEENLPQKQQQKLYREINGIIKRGETFFEVFKRFGLDMAELFKIREAAADVHRLRDVEPGRQYKIVVDIDNRVNSLLYWIDDDNILNITRSDKGFSAGKIPLEYERRIEHIGGIIKDNLISSIGEDRENLMLALQLSDIFAWDIDFTSDLRNGDVFKIVVEGLYIDGGFKKYREILSAEFENNGKLYHAYRFENNGKADYYDAEGKALKKAFLKAPLNFRRISSYFSAGRFHPVLKIYRPHHGLDYAAPAGTPVSAVGDGEVFFAGRKGQYGNLVVIKHRNGWKTYYGHLSKIEKGIWKGKYAEQGQIIGYVGATGLATGPHLHYEIRTGKKPVNPLKVKFPGGEPIPKSLMAGFEERKNKLDHKLTLIDPAVFTSAKKVADKKI
jgi:murein DD-endopeptidase MepM/ murein hydrolase activator NlpD